MNEDIKVYFVIPKEYDNENSCSEDMLQAFVACEQHRGGGLHPRWVPEKDCSEFDTLTKKDVYVLNEFKGSLYQKLKSTKCLLIGPRCLSCCLMEGSSIPPGPEPVFTIGMRGLAVTASGLTKLQKDNIRQKVQWMGGRYDVLLMDDTTHLVSNTVLSDKYIKAVQKNIPVMNEDWIEDVWQTSHQLNVNGSSAQFNKHLLQPFANLGVTTSGIGKKEKEPLARLVAENGGKFMGTFQSETTDVVVLNKEGVGSDKYKAAVQFNKLCVLPSWIIESAKQGVALPIDKYTVVGAKTSSPLHSLPDMSLNFSRITNVRQNNYIDESRDISTLSAKVKVTQEKRTSNESSMSKEIESAFENLDMSEIKNAGPIFDGYCIWVNGPEGVWKERARACVSRCGGVRYDAAHSRVTHIVAATSQHARLSARTLPAALVLCSRWLLDSVRERRAVSPDKYLLGEESPKEEKTRTQNVEASPMSKRNLQLLRPPQQTPITPQKEEAPVDDAPEHLLHYLSQPMKEKTPEPEIGQNVTTRRTNVTEVTQEDLTEEIEQVFEGLQIEVQGLDEEALCEVGAEVSSAGGVLVAAGSGGSHVLVPLDFDPKLLGDTDQNIITVFWIKDCLTQMELVPIEYYHRPVCITEELSTCLKGLVISLSTYTGIERAYLDELAKLLGAVTQLRFSRRTTPTSIASTHLLCPEPSGEKYIGAVKWGFPAVTAQWLRDCVTHGRRLYEGPYLVGDTKAPDRIETKENKAQLKTVTEMGPPTEKVPPRKLSIQNCNSKENTPKGKQFDNDAELSPASRYIAMARQGLLGETQETPKRVNDLQEQAKQDNETGFRTPPLDDALSTPNLMLLSPTTRRRLNAIKKGEMPSGPITTPTNPFNKGPKTPDSSFGAALRPGSEKLSPQSRKRLWDVVQALPEKQPPGKVPTPLSEVRSKFLAQFKDESPLHAEHSAAPRKLYMKDQFETPPNKKFRLSEVETSKTNQTPQTIEKSSASSGISTSNALPEGLDAQLQQLSATLCSRNSTPGQRSRRTRDSTPKPEDREAEVMTESQPNTVGWDDSTPEQSAQSTQTPGIRRFVFSSNVDNLEELTSMIKALGGECCETSDHEPTHLICSGLNRSEKLLCAIAAGRWLLHPLYIINSHANGTFLSEEDYEWGNPSAPHAPKPKDEAERVLAAGGHRWRVNRQNHQPGPYRGLRVLLHVAEGRRPLLAKLVQVGGGVVVDERPPLKPDIASRITVCLADVRRCPLSAADAGLLRGQVPVCPAVMLSNYLTDTIPPQPQQFCLNEFKL